MAAGDRWYFREYPWDKNMGRPPLVLGDALVVRYEKTTPSGLFASYGTDSGYASAAELAAALPTTKSGGQGALDRQIGNIVLQNVTIYDTPIEAPATTRSASVTSPDRRTYWRYDDAALENSRPRKEVRIGALEADDDFDPLNVEDVRDRAFRAIKVRRGQKAFRSALLTAYGQRCAVTGCAVLELLEAAHIIPYLGSDTNHVTNGVLLRADLHTLYDCVLVSIDPQTLQLAIAPCLSDSSYRHLAGRTLRRTQTTGAAPSKRALAHHFAEFQKRHCRW